ncbi:MAG: hypothetical protein U0936_11160 [Planctomycetaceae bacterium]
MTRAASPTARRKAARESFKNAADDHWNDRTGNESLYHSRAVAGSIDAVLHVLDQVGPAAVSLWTWTVAEYEVQVLTRLRIDKRITAGRP